MLAEAIDIIRWLSRDECTGAARHRRDRLIGRASGSATELRQVRQWWRTQGEPPSQLGLRAAGGRRLCSAVMVGVGLLLGCSLAAGALAYEGRYPVNLVSLMVLVVGLPGLMLIATLWMLPLRAGSRLRAALPNINPGRWAAGWLQRWLGDEVELLTVSSAGAGRFLKWQGLVWSQMMAVSFFAGVVVTMLAMVTFTDLAFGWSTTLDVAPTQVARWVEFVSAPWSRWLPVAAPTLELVETSRYFRLDSGGRMQVSSLGDWWPFVVMTVLFYGLLPRLVLLLAGWLKLRSAERSLLLRNREVVGLLQRMNTPVVDLGPDLLDADADQDDSGKPNREHTAGVASSPGAAVSGVLIIWNASLAAQEVEPVMRVLGITPTAMVNAGSEEDKETHARKLAEQLRRTKDGNQLFVVTKGWEPPLLEFKDFIGVLRAAVKPETFINVVPVNVAKTGIDPADARIWQGALARYDDPRVLVWALSI